MICLTHKLKERFIFLGDRYQLILKCAWCGKDNDVYYAESCEQTDFICDYCKKKNKISLIFETIKYDQETKAKK